MIGIALDPENCHIALMNSKGIPVLVPDKYDVNQTSTKPFGLIQNSTVIIGSQAQTYWAHNQSSHGFNLSKILVNNKFYEDEKEKKWSRRSYLTMLFNKLYNDIQVSTSQESCKVAIALPESLDQSAVDDVKSAALLAGFSGIQTISQAKALGIYHQSLNTQMPPQYFTCYLTQNTTIISCNNHSTGASSHASLDFGLKTLVGDISKTLSQFYEYSESKTLDIPEDTLNSWSEEILHSFQQPVTSVHFEGMYNSKHYTLFISRTEIVQVLKNFSLKLAKAFQGIAKTEEETCLLINSIASPLNLLKKELANTLEISDQSVFEYNFSETISYGASIYSHQQTQIEDKPERKQQLQATPHDLCLNTYNSATKSFQPEVLIKKGSCLPVEVKKTYSSNRAGQERIVLELVIRESVHKLESLGVFEFKLPPNCAKGYIIDVSISYDTKGNLHVKATDPMSKTEVEQVISAANDQNAAKLEYDRKLLATVKINPQLQNMRF